PFETGTAAGQRGQSELPVSRPEVPVEVRRVHVAIRAPLAHGRRLRRDVESQPATLLPNRDRLDRAAGREVAVAGRPHAGSDDASGNASAMQSAPSRANTSMAPPASATASTATSSVWRALWAWRALNT